MKSDLRVVVVGTEDRRLDYGPWKQNVLDDCNGRRRERKRVQIVAA